jgi:hypothetical protein
VGNDWRKGNTPPPRIPHPQSVAARNFNWASVGAPNPDSVEGRNFDWSKLGVPNPNSIAGRQTDWRVSLGSTIHNEAEELAEAIEEVEKFLNGESEHLRIAIEDRATEELYVQQLGPLEANIRFLTPQGRVGADMCVMARRLQIALGWFNRDLVRSSAVGQNLTSALDKAYLLRQPMALRKKKDLLGAIRLCFGDVFAAVRKDIEDQREQEKRFGELAILFERWRMEMKIRPAYAPNAWGFKEAEILPAPSSYSQSGKGSNREKSEPKAPEKTWVEFRLIDQDGKPVGDVAYKVTLPDGEVFTGRLNSQGVIRFDSIDPGDCQIGFPEIDGEEWKAA